MAGNSFGKNYCVTTCGESHGPAIATIIDGCPAGIELTESDIQAELDRRKPGQSDLTSPRQEDDKVEIMSGVFEGKTLGTPILLLVKNKNFNSADYSNLKDIYRPSHADYTYEKRYGIRDYRGGGRASARETIARVAAAVPAKKYLQRQNIEILAYVESVKDIVANVDIDSVTREEIEANAIRCPDQNVAKKMEELIKSTRQAGDSVGGVICGVIRNVPAGVGNPVFDKINADLAKAMFSINAVKGFEIGSGFVSTRMLGSEHNDPFYFDEEEQKVKTRRNNSGGIQGGITNGMPITFRVAFKPVPTIFKEQNSLTNKGESVEFKCSGRHDNCVLARAVPIVEAMATIVIMDQILSLNK